MRQRQNKTSNSECYNIFSKRKREEEEEEEEKEKEETAMMYNHF
jgi:hypothetical protein